MTFNEIITLLEKRGVIPTTTPSIEPLRNALKESGLLLKINPTKTIVIAGTNGKGSICATLSALLTHAKKKVGLYTSPHLISTTERFRINDEDISEDEFTLAYEALLPLIEKHKLSHFESLTLIAAWIFYSGNTRPAVEYSIWEVGMGGLWDASNAIPHDFCGISKLGLDHQFFLGNDLQSIAAQKFGIITKNAQVVFSPMDERLTSLRKKTQNEQNCQWIEIPPYKYLAPNNLDSAWGKVTLNLIGLSAAENTMHALKLFELLGFSPQSHLENLKKVRWPGRFSKAEWKNLHCPLYLSGDHNLEGIKSLISILKEFHFKTLHLIVGIGADKEVEKILENLSSLLNVSLYLTETTLKPLSLDDYPKEYKSKAKLCDKSLVNILDHITQQATKNDLVIITGSLYLVGHFLSLTKEKYHE